MKLNRTTLRTVEILKLVSKKPDGITLDEICAKLDMPKTSAYDIVTTLVQTGMIHVAREQKQRYTIGLTAYRIGINYTNNLDFISTIDPVLKAFSREVGKTVFFGIRSDDSIVYICKFEPENPIITTATVGTKIPFTAHPSARQSWPTRRMRTGTAYCPVSALRSTRIEPSAPGKNLRGSLNRCVKRDTPLTPGSWKNTWNA